MIKNVIAFVAGAAVGSAAAYIFVKKQYDGKIDEAVESVKEYDRRQIEALKNRTLKAERLVEMMERENEKVKMDSEAEKVAEERVRTNYNALAKKYVAEEEAKYGTDEIEDKNYLDGLAMAEITNSKEGPVQILAEDFGELPEIDAQSLYYYSYDGTLVTEDEEIVDDADRVVGDILESSGFTDDNTPVIYIRNLLLGSDYEITKVFSSFGEK